MVENDARTPGLDRTGRLISPYGGGLTDLVASDRENRELLERAGRLPSVQVSPRSLCDIELLATGAFSPLDRFLGKADYERVLHEMRLADGTLFPIPITLPVVRAAGIQEGSEIALRSLKNELIAIMAIEELFDRNALEARLVCGTTDTRHPLVAEMESWGPCCISGPLKVIQLPKHYDFTDLRKTPAEVRGLLGSMGYGDVVAFQTRNPIHRAHEELTKRAAQQTGGRC